MHRFSRIIALALLLTVAVAPVSAFAASHSGASAAPASLWSSPLRTLWEWVSAKAAALGMAPRLQSSPSASKPASAPTPTVHTDEGSAADPYGG